ncbi:MAG: 2-vinyl bacteriochlorophyllide hydratase [Pseudomonadota bacterium]
MGKREALTNAPKPLYTAAERKRRDETYWTVVQGILAPLQFLVFLVSLFLVVRYLLSGVGAELATWSVIIKTLVLYAIMITGSLWERAVFGHYLFVPAFFWEDVVSMLVMALHTAYLFCVWFGWLDVSGQMYLAIAAYAAYVINAAQFLWKFRLARLSSSTDARLDVSNAGEVTA